MKTNWEKNTQQINNAINLQNMKQNVYIQKKKVKINVSHLSFTEHLYNRSPSVPQLVCLPEGAGEPPLLALKTLQGAAEALSRLAKAPCIPGRALRGLQAQCHPLLC